MDTACLKLKFTPLTQSIKGSKSTCCLEIVPEISCIENLDTLNWRNESEVIEYTIPMTYKITLKKSSFKEYVLNSSKEYHSCVDLLIPNSSLENCGCGDVPRMMSDNLMVYHYLNKKLMQGNKTRLGVKEENVEDSDLLTVYIEDQNNSDPSMVSNQIECVECVYTETHHNIRDTSKSLNKNRVCQDRSVRICTTSTNTSQNITDDSDIDEIRNSSTETDNVSYEKRLTLSPICSVSTDEEDQAPELYKNNDIIETIIFPKAFRDVHHDLVMNMHQYNLFEVAKKPNLEMKSSGSNENRLSVEAKFQNFMRMMEREMRPVNAMFEDIINKCDTLGIQDKICKRRKAIDYQQPTTCKDEVNKSCTFESMCKSKSNRVVYTVKIIDG